MLAFLAAARSQPRGNELERYVAMARIAGQSDEQIRRKAVAAGWGEPAVTDAIRRATPKVPANSGTAPGALSHISRGLPYDYQIGAGDVLQINVWREPEASVPSTVVRPDGKISVPLISDVEVVGLTPKQAEGMLAQELGRFITGAHVTVVVTSINSKKVYLVGAVKTEGTLAYSYRMSVLQAITEGGGLTDYAKRKKIYVLRTQNGRQFRLPFDFDAVVKGERTEMNIALLPDDTVVIPY
jgi:polysaccharide export outer membrane protein